MEAEVVNCKKYSEYICSKHDFGTLLYQYNLDILCLMALADAFGFEYGKFV